jgi:hypothetical protein
MRQASKNRDDDVIARWQNLLYSIITPSTATLKIHMLVRIIFLALVLLWLRMRANMSRCLRDHSNSLKISLGIRQQSSHVHRIASAALAGSEAVHLPLKHGHVGVT